MAQEIWATRDPTVVPLGAAHEGLQRSPVDVSGWVVKRPPQKVQIFSLAPPRPGATKETKRWYVKWRIDGRDRSRSFKTKAEADRLRSVLLLAVQEGQLFDEETGLPAAWSPTTSSGPTWWSWSREWLELKWPQWSGHSRRTAVETLVALAPLMVRSGATEPPRDLAKWLRAEGYLPGTSPKAGPQLAWITKWSVPLQDINVRLLEAVLQKVGVKANGTMAVPSVVRRRRGTLGAVLRSATRRGMLSSNPLEQVEVRSTPVNNVVDVSLVPSPTEVARAIDHVAVSEASAARYAALYATVGLAGMRPSEAIGLLVRDLELPEKGWGVARLRGALTSPGTRYTASGEQVEHKALKHRAVGVVREVPLAPGLVSRLRDHLKQWPSVEGRVFSNASGRPITPTNYGPPWNRARAALWPDDHHLAKVTVYDLRHAAATMMLRANVPPAEVARRLGHSVDMLMKIYAGVFSDERDRSNDLIDAALKRIRP